MVRVAYGMLIACLYHAIHAQKASSLAEEVCLLQQKFPLQHLHSGFLSPSNEDELLLLGQATCCSQMAHRYFICLLCSVGMGCSLNTEKQKDWEMHRRMPRDGQPWKAQAARRKVCQTDVSLLRASFPGSVFFPTSITFSSFARLLPTAWGTLAWWRSVQSFLSFFFL